MTTTRPELIGTFGMVASTHWQASAAGMAMLEQGGNAFDAAAATGLALQVVEPHQNGPGGEAPLLLYDAAGRTVRALSGQGVAPAAANISRFSDLGLDQVPGTGLLAACVPAALASWLTLMRDHGTLPLTTILSPAIALAERGYGVVPMLQAVTESVAGFIVDNWPATAALYLDHGKPLQAGTLWQNPTLAATFRRLLKEAEAGGGGREPVLDRAIRTVRQGFIAEEIDRFCQSTTAIDSTGRAHRAWLTGEDMAAWRPSWESPATYDYTGWQVSKLGPWSQGPVFLQQLALLQDDDLARLDPVGPDFIHLMVEAGKLAFADREAWYGDPAYVDVPLATLLSKAYNQSRRGLIGDRASLDLRPGTPDGRTPHLVTLANAGHMTGAAGVGEPARHRLATPRHPTEQPGDTVHLDVIDSAGNMVSAMPSGGWLQSSPAIPALGFCLGTRMQMFHLDAAHPSALAPGRRPRTTLSPGLAITGDSGLAFGSPGGDQQDQWALALFLRHIHHGFDLQASIEAPMETSVHAPSSFYPRQGRPGVLLAESRLPAATVTELVRRG
ncbi:MAG: gamma-glutamyltransferase, partial [Alphaproteobacteria bacterium]